ncbi:extracellular superoxide dismutase [Megalops cyprinoides]|uniref:extracellular superoxide dismutase n=1 Tax=Megalops cyprinoides TaxID=118141 RepID=UPI0018651927|nr:extracellular superoxide dismutase [Megalops cyprinoides]
MAQTTRSLSCLLLAVFIGSQAPCCEGVSPSEESAIKTTSSADITDFNGTLYAACEMKPSATLPDGQLQIYGQVLFKQGYPKGTLSVMVNLHNLPYKDNQSRAIHIHEYGDLSEGCDASGGHYNPLKVNHPNHPGDLGNFSSRHRRIRKLMSSAATLFGEQSVLGRAVVIHEKEDDMGLSGNAGSLLHGNAGRRLACCTIGISSSKLWEKTVESTFEEETK